MPGHGGGPGPASASALIPAAMAAGPASSRTTATTVGQPGSATRMGKTVPTPVRYNADRRGHFVPDVAHGEARRRKPAAGPGRRALAATGASPGSQWP